jgi:L-threonylcarbamoyladenylate synthase
VKTEISTDPKRAVELLGRGEIVALPTETVYGLAADALDPIAVAKIFEAKARPSFDPLIVHLPDFGWFERVANIPTQDRQLVFALTEKFWPGPFTIVLPKCETVPEIVTAGLQTVAVRISANPIFAEIIRAFARPLAAPSANRFGRISPTTAEHVAADLEIPLVIDGGRTEYGLESTIVAINAHKIDILRRGPITDEQLSIFGDVTHSAAAKISAPGQLPSHYAPRKPLKLVDEISSFASDKRIGLLGWKTSGSGGFQPPAEINGGRGDRRSLKVVAIRRLSDKQDLREAAANLFRYLRELDANEDVDLIVAERVPDRGLGAAIMDRLRRAAHRSDAPTPPR